MLSEPLTLPPTRWQQLVVATVVAVLFAIPFSIGDFLVGPETALVVGNLIAFAFGQRKGIELVVTGKTALSPTTLEFVFRPVRELRFSPGQYLELTLPHRGADSRGTRRVFSISSPPGDVEAVSIGVKVSPKGSSFKRALQALEVGGTVRATGISGDFTLPDDPDVPLLLIAGGIGITPFASQLAALDPGTRDITVIYAASDAAELTYLPVLERSGARVVAVTSGGSDHTSEWGAAAFETVTDSRVDRDTLTRLVPDIAKRHVFVSGPPALVNEVAAAASALNAKALTKDYFSGY